VMHGVISTHNLKPWTRLKRLWGMFQALISGALEGVREQLGSAVDTVMSAIIDTCTGLFCASLTT
jgi:hypothetical protein